MGAMAWSRVASCWLVCTMAACVFDSSTGGGGAAAGSTSDDASTSGVEPTMTSAGPTSSETTETPTSASTLPVTTDDSESESDTGSSTTTGSTVETETGSTGGTGTTADACEMPATFAHLLWVQDLPAAAIADMDLVESISIQLDGMPVTYARSLTENVGSVTFEFDTECDGEVYIWGLVFDWVPSQTSGPDSYWYGIDVEAMADGDAWVYGCTTSVSGWSWQPLQHYNASPCDTDPLVPTLAGGPHTFMLLNREPGSTGFEIYDFAGVAAIAISNDAAYDPNSDFTP